jgi:predicted kinase
MTMEERIVKTLLMTVGGPRSGKTTWAKDKGHPIVSPDAIRLALHGKSYISNAEPFVWAIARTMVAALFEAGHDTVILDACNNSVRRRDDWKSSRWMRAFIIFDTATTDVCVQRARADGRDDLIPVITRMAEQHEPVTDAEHDMPCTRP